MERTDKKLKLYTLQPVGVYEKLEREGVLLANPELVCGDFKDAYKWMIGKMDEFGIEKPEGALTPWWAWFRIDGVEGLNIEQLRYLGKPGETYKLLCVEVDAKDALLSDFDEWHNVLNDAYCDESSNEEEWNRVHEVYDSLPAECKEVLKKVSWNKVFDIGMRENEWMSNGKFVQACFWKLVYADVLGAWNITCKEIEE